MKAMSHCLLTGTIARGAAIAVAVSTPQVAAAQRYGRPAPTVENRAILALRGSARCAVGEAPPSARKILETQVASDEEKKRVKMLIAVARKCYPTTWPEFSPTLVRGAIAESLYLDAHRNASPKSASGPAPSTFGVVPAGTPGTADQEVAWTLAAVANCVVFADAADVHHLLLGPAAVDEEMLRFEKLRPSMELCLPGSQNTKLTPATFRGYLAESLYRHVNGDR